MEIIRKSKWEFQKIIRIYKDNRFFSLLKLRIFKFCTISEIFQERGFSLINVYYQRYRIDRNLYIYPK